MTRNALPRRRTVLRFAAELVVVFVGVYGAFLLNEYRESRAEDRRAAQIYGTLHQYFSDTASDLHNASAQVDSFFVAPWMTAYRAGEMPRPFTLPFGTSGVNTSMWEAMLQSGGLDVLDVDFIYEVETFFLGISYMVDILDRFADRVDRNVLPRLDEPAAVFYDEETRALRRDMQWYVQDLGMLMQQLESSIARSDSVVAHIERRMIARGLDVPPRIAP